MGYTKEKKRGKKNEASEKHRPPSSTAYRPGYPQKIKRLLANGNIKIGDWVLIEKEGREYKGLLLPRTELCGNTLIIKLENGYNIGIGYSSDLKIKKVKDSVEKKLGKNGVGNVSAKSKDSLAIIAVGGTILSKIDYRTGGVTTLMEPRDLLTSIPEIAEIATVKKILQPINVMSEDLRPKDWVSIAKVVGASLKKEKGVIIPHGTDTMHYTASALSFMLQNLNKPVVLTGAQRSPDRGSSDAHMNLICSAHLAVSDIAEVGICMHGSISDDYCLFIRGTKARKMHTSRRDAFRPINDLPIAKVYPEGKISNLQGYNRRHSGEPVIDTKFEEKVALLKTYPGAVPQIEYLIGEGFKGFVVEGTGLGHVPTRSKNSWIPQIRNAIREGIPVVITSQTLYGRINTNVYANLRRLYYEARAISGEDMLPETAYVKLGWILGHTADLDEVRKLVRTNLVGEISSRGLPEMFLY